MNTVYGVVLSRDGLASASTLAKGPGGPMLRREHWATPSDQLLSAQDPVIPVDRDHDHRKVGEVVHLERASNGDVWCVAHVDAAVTPVALIGVGERTVSVERDLFWSCERVGDLETGFLLVGVALTPTPARLAARPVAFRQGELNHRHAADRWDGLGWFEKGLLTRAAHYGSDRRHRADREEPTIVHEPWLNARHAHGPLAQRRDQQQRELTGGLRRAGEGRILRIR